MPDRTPPSVLALVGPTASGKTGLAVELARRLPAEVVNVDSMQVFRGLDVGTDKPTTAMRAETPFHCVDVADPGDPYDAARFAADADRAIQDTARRGKLPIAAGGTGLYHRALRFGLVATPPRDDTLRAELRARRDRDGVEAMHAALKAIDPDTAARVLPRDWVRIERALEVHTLTGRTLTTWHEAHGFQHERYRLATLGCWRPRQALYDGIDARLDEMWQGGLLDETQALLERGLPRDLLPLKALGYRHAAAFLSGERTEAEALAEAKRDTRRFARRQLIWFRSDPTIRWLSVPLTVAQLDALAAAVDAFWRGASLDLGELPVVSDV